MASGKCKVLSYRRKPVSRTTMDWPPASAGVTITIRFFLLTFALCLLNSRSSHAISIITGPTLSVTSINSETNNLANGVTVQLTLDTAGQVQIAFSQVSPIDSSLTQVASITQLVPANTPTSIFWNALWLIGTTFARHDGTFSYQVTPSTNNAPGTPLPVAGDPSALFTINSVDIHNLTIIPSLDASGQSTFPYHIVYLLAKPASVTATIANSSGTLVRTIISGQLQAGETTSTATVTWDGLDNSGKSAPLGIYFSTITATDPTTGDHAIPRSQSFAVTSLGGAALSDPQKQFESNVFVYPDPVRNGQGTFQMEAIQPGANLSLKIYTITGTLVFEQTFPGIAAGTLVTFPWKAVNQAGNKVGRGLYYYVVREDDSIGTLQTVKKMVVLP